MGSGLIVWIETWKHTLFLKRAGASVDSVVIEKKYTQKGGRERHLQAIWGFKPTMAHKVQRRLVHSAPVDGTPSGAYRLPSPL